MRKAYHDNSSWPLLMDNLKALMHLFVLLEMSAQLTTESVLCLFNCYIMGRLCLEILYWNFLHPSIMCC